MKANNSIHLATMEERLYDFISMTFCTTVAVVLAVLVLAFYLVHYITKKVTIITKDHDDAKEGIGRTQKDIDEIRRDLAYIKGSIDILTNSSNPYIQSHSPVSLTDKGREMMREMNGEQMISDNWAHICTTLRDMESRNAYDIQTFCVETADTEPEKFFDYPTINTIKDFAYNKGMPVQLFLRMLGILIRDRYFALHDIPLDRVDESNPNRQTP